MRYDSQHTLHYTYSRTYMKVYKSIRMEHIDNKYNKYSIDRQIDRQV